MGDACENDTLSSCNYIYGVHDGGKNNTQLLRYNAVEGIEKLAPPLPGYDVEALDISPDKVLYDASGDDTSNLGFLYFLKIKKNQGVTKYRFYRNSLNIQHNFCEP